MSCEICGRSSCTRSFHSIDEQEAHDDPVAALKQQLTATNAKLEEALSLIVGARIIVELWRTEDTEGTLAQHKWKTNWLEKANMLLNEES